MCDELEVEVLEENGIILKAFLVDILENEVEVCFEKNWKPESRFPLNVIKLPPQKMDRKFEENEEVEVKISVSDAEEVYGWRRAIIMHIIEDTYIIRNQNLLYETINSDFLRLPNNNPSLNHTSFSKIEIEVPEELKSYAEKAGVHDEFKKLVKGESCKYISGKGVLRIISAKKEETKKLVDMVKDMHFLHLETKLKNESKANYSEEFEVLQHLMGLSIGKRGSNINQARLIKDVTNVKHIQGTTRFIVSGKTEEAVKEARNMLEYTEKRIEVPKFISEKIQDEVIEEIVDKSEVIRIEIGDDDLLNDENTVPFVFVGRAETVNDAEIMFRFHLALLSEDNKQEITKQSDEPKNASCYIERFAVRQELMGLIIGKNGCRIKKTKKIDGILKVEIKNKSNVIEIQGKTEEAVKKVRELLEVDEQIIKVPNKDVGKVVGKKGLVIRQIESSSGVLRIKIDKATESSDLVHIAIIGSRKNINIAKKLIGDHVVFSQ